jgi:mRNA-degrading endonuclease RelE of RelBE toxin-antitoxin system
VRLALQAWAAEKLQDPERFGLQEIDSVSAGLRYKILTYVLIVGILDSEK